MKPICLRHRSMGCFSPGSPLLSSCLGKRMATLLRDSPDSARLGFSLWAIAVPPFSSAIPSQRWFYPGVSTLAYLPSRSQPSHLCSAFPCSRGRRWVAIPEPARRERLMSLKFGNFVLLAEQKSTLSVCTAAGRPALPSPSAAVVSVACSAEPALSRVLWPKKLRSVGCAVPFCHVFGY